MEHRAVIVQLGHQWHPNMLHFSHTSAFLLAVSVTCGASPLVSGQIELPSPPTRQGQIELPSPPTQDRRIELPSPPAKKGRIETPSPSTRNGNTGGYCGNTILPKPIVTWNPCTGQNQVSYMATIEGRPSRLAPVYVYRRDSDVAYSEDEITDRHNVRMTRRYLSDDGQWRQHIVWVTRAFAARHGYQPGIKMIRHYHDRSGNKREQIVFVTREIAAHWGYTPIESSESANSTAALRSPRSE